MLTFSEGHGYPSPSFLPPTHLERAGPDLSIANGLEFLFPMGVTYE